MAFPERLAIFEKALGPEHPDTATSLHNLAFLLQDQLKFEKCGLSRWQRA